MRGAVDEDFEGVDELGIIRKEKKMMLTCRYRCRIGGFRWLLRSLAGIVGSRGRYFRI